VPRGDQGGGDRRRGRGRNRARSRVRVRRKRRGLIRSCRRPRCRAPGPRAATGDRMSERRRTDPIPLGGGDEPYSKGLMARALMRVGVSAVRAYEVARRIEEDLLSRKQDAIELDRVEELAEDVLGESEGVDAVRRLRRYGELAEL